MHRLKKTLYGINKIIAELITILYCCHFDSISCEVHYMKKRKKYLTDFFLNFEMNELSRK